MKVHLTKEQEDLLDSGSKVVLSCGEEWRYLPYWFKKNTDGSFDLVTYDQIPETVREVINDFRNSKP